MIHNYIQENQKVPRNTDHVRLSTTLSTARPSSSALEHRFGGLAT